MDTQPAIGPNVEQIRAHASRVIRGKMPAAVRSELLAAVRAGLLGRLPKDGLKPEIFFHPDHRNGAIERQKREAEYAVGCIAKVMAPPPSAEERVNAVFDAIAGKRGARDGLINLAIARGELPEPIFET